MKCCSVGQDIPRESPGLASISLDRRTQGLGVQGKVRRLEPLGDREEGMTRKLGDVRNRFQRLSRCLNLLTLSIPLASLPRRSRRMRSKLRGPPRRWLHSCLLGGAIPLADRKLKGGCSRERMLLSTERERTLRALGLLQQYHSRFPANLTMDLELNRVKRRSRASSLRLGCQQLIFWRTPSSLPCLRQPRVKRIARAQMHR